MLSLANATVRFGKGRSAGPQSVNWNSMDVDPRTRNDSETKEKPDTHAVAVVLTIVLSSLPSARFRAKHTHREVVSDRVVNLCEHDKCVLGTAGCVTIVGIDYVLQTSTSSCTRLTRVGCRCLVEYMRYEPPRSVRVTFPPG